MSSQSPQSPIIFHPDFLSKYDNIIFDMDGVIWKSHVFLPGTVDTLNALQEVHNKRVFFCTNNSTQHRSTYFPTFEKNGLRIPQSHLYTSASTAASIVFHTIFNGVAPEEKKEGEEEGAPAPKVLVIGQPGLQKEFHDYGLKKNVVTLAELRNEHTKDLHALKHFVVPKDITAVVVGLQTDFCWTDCAIAVTILRESRPPADFLATNCDVTYPATDTRLLPGAGSVVNMIKGSCGRNPKVMGKPTEFMLKAIMAEHSGIDLSRTLMIGDRLDTDIAFGNNFGMDTLLVMSGVTNLDEYRASVGGFVIPSQFFTSPPESGSAVNREGVTISSAVAAADDDTDDDEVLSPVPPPLHVPAQPSDPRPTYVAKNINELLRVGPSLM